MDIDDETDIGEGEVELSESEWSGRSGYEDSV